MSFIDRYIMEVGRHLPRKTRGDIQAELRSAIQDALEGRFGPEPEEDEVLAMLEEFGPPKNVAASYYPGGQYLIGPALFPLFRMVAGIGIAAVLGAQVLAWAIAFFVANDPISPLQAIGGIFNSVPMTIGMVVIVFALLQRLDVHPDLEDEAWDPSSLPELGEVHPVSRGERIFGIIAGTVVLAVLVIFPQYVGFVNAPGGEFFVNPVILDYRIWISLSLLLNIALDIYLLWQARWTTLTRLAKLGIDMLGVVVLLVLIQAHTAWLTARNAGGFFTSLDRFASEVEGGWQVLGMQAFRLAFVVALIVIVVDTIVSLVRIVHTKARVGAYTNSLKTGSV